MRRRAQTPGGVPRQGRVAAPPRIPRALTSMWRGEGPLIQRFRESCFEPGPNPDRLGTGRTRPKATINIIKGWMLCA